MTKSLEDLKKEASDAAAKKGNGGGKVKTPENIESTFRAGSDSKIIFDVLKAAKKEIPMGDIIDRCVKRGINNPERPKVVVRWFVKNHIVLKHNDGTYSLIRPKATADEAQDETATAS